MQARPKPVAPALKDLADRLSDVFETRVKVELGQRKGKIVVEFASLDDLERIVETHDARLVPARTLPRPSHAACRDRARGGAPAGLGAGLKRQTRSGMAGGQHDSR